MNYLEELKKSYNEMLALLHKRALALQQEGCSLYHSYGCSVKHLGVKYNNDESENFYEDAIEKLQLQLLEQYQVYNDSFVVGDWHIPLTQEEPK